MESYVTCVWLLSLSIRFARFVQIIAWIITPFFFSVPGFELRAYTLNHSTALFCIGFFEIGSHGTICLGWLPTTILLISTS
jgi:hypothetical protein